MFRTFVACRRDVFRPVGKRLERLDEVGGEERKVVPVYVGRRYADPAVGTVG